MDKPIAEGVLALVDELMQASAQEDIMSASIAYADAAGRLRTLAGRLTAAQQPIREGGGEVSEAELIALVAGPYMYHHKMDEAAEREARAFDRCREMTIQNIQTWCATRRAMFASAPPSAPVGLAAMRALVEAVWEEYCSDVTEQMEPDDSKVSYPEDRCHITFGMIRRAREALAQLPADREEMSPDFTDSARAAIAWVLYHHQGGSSPVGQPLRFALGMGAGESLPDWRIAEAKAWAAWAKATTADFHRQQPAAAP
jgi:hypothetical protein